MKLIEGEAGYWHIAKGFWRRHPVKATSVNPGSASVCLTPSGRLKGISGNTFPVCGPRPPAWIKRLLQAGGQQRFHLTMRQQQHKML